MHPPLELRVCRLSIVPRLHLALCNSGVSLYYVLASSSLRVRLCLLSRERSFHFTMAARTLPSRFFTNPYIPRHPPRPSHDTYP